MTPVGPNRFTLGNSGAELVFAPGGPGGARECRTLPPPGSKAAPVSFTRLAPVAATDHLEDYAGAYNADELDVVWTFSVKDDALVMGIRGDTGEPFVRVDRDTFIQDTGLIVEFGREGNVVTGGRLHAGRVRNLRFKRAS